MSKINHEAIHPTVFNEHRLLHANALAIAYVQEAFSDNPRDNYLNTLYEMGQGRFSEHLNSRENREKLFNKLVNIAAAKYMKAGQN